MFLILFRQGRNTENKMHITNSHHVSLNDTNTCIRFQKVDKNLNNRLKIINTIMIPLFYQPIKMLTDIFK